MKYYIVGLSDPDDDPALETFKNELIHNSEFQHPDVELHPGGDEDLMQQAFETQRSRLK